MSETESGATTVRTGWGWFLAYGLLTIVVGVLALTNPPATGLATGILLGFLLALYGGAAIVAGFSGSRWIEVVLGVLALLVAVAILFDPFAGALSLVWTIGAWLLLSGLVQIHQGAKAAADRGWRIAMGVVDALLGGFLLFSSPPTALLFLAISVGISLLIRGVFLLFLASGLRRLGQIAS